MAIGDAAGEWHRVIEVLASDGQVERAVPMSSEPFEIGRHATGVECPDDDQMADRHARLELSESGVRIADLGEGSGVWLRIQGSDGRALDDRDQIWLGSQILVARQEHEGWVLRHHGPDGRLRAEYDVPATGLFIGRASELVLDPEDGELSRRHAQVAYEGGVLRFFDRGAHNGSYLRLRAAETLSDGSEFRLATHRFRLTERHLESPAFEEAVSAPPAGEEKTMVFERSEPIPARDFVSDRGQSQPDAQSRSAEQDTSPQPSRGLAGRLRNLGRRAAPEGPEEVRPEGHGEDGNKTHQLASPDTPVGVGVGPSTETETGPHRLVIDSAAGPVSVEIESGQTVLEAVQAAGLPRGGPVDWECGDGGCGVCVVAVVEGADRLDPPDPNSGEMKVIQITEQVSPDPLKYRLACLARVRGAVRLRTLT